MALRGLLLLCVVLAACGGDPEKNRICLGRVCPESGQSQACAKYVACYLRTGGTPGVLDSSYGPSGSCWTTTLAARDACTAACTSSVRSLQMAYDAGC